MMCSTDAAFGHLLAPRASEIERAGEDAGAHEQMTADQQVLHHGHVREQLGMLEGAADAGKRDLVHRHGRQIVAIEHDMAGIRPVDAVDAVQKRGLAGPVRADNRNQLAIAGTESNAIESGEAAELES